MHALLDGVADDETVHHRRALLTDPVDTTDRLHKQDQNSVQGGPSASGKKYVDIKLKVPSLAWFTG